jgi:hypothetical protein
MRRRCFAVGELTIAVATMSPVHWPGQNTAVTAEGGLDVAPSRVSADPALVKALARAFRYQRLLDEGRYASMSEMSAAENIERGYLGTLLRLTLLAPDIVEVVLEERQPADLTLPRLLGPYPTSWSDHRALFG